jgi:septal ring factor EnvC (AmiA/AmiB activator)
MIITSGGIYGYLSSAYSETSNKLEVIDKNVAVYDLKRDRFSVQLEDIRTERNSLTESIKELSKGLSNNVIQYKDEDGNIITTTSSATRKVLERQLNDSKAQRDKLSLRLKMP